MKALHVILVAALICRAGTLLPCEDYTCDSLVVAEILDSNGYNPAWALNFAQKKLVGGVPRIAALRFTGNVWMEPQRSRFTTLPPSVGRLSALDTIDLVSAAIQDLPEAMGGLTRLKLLRVYRNQIRSLPESIGNLKNLSYLDAGYNHIASVPSSMCELSHLEFLGLDSNMLTAIPQSIGQLHSLKGLFVRYNALTALPESLGDLANLQYLNISNNQIPSLPASAANLIALTDLDICNNKFDTFPDPVTALSGLSILNAGGNGYTRLPDSFCALTNLSILRLNNEQLQSLPACFGALAKLTKLYLSGNRLQELPESFCGLSQLQYVNLAVNKLQQLPDPFGDLTAVVWLDLSENQLAALPSSMMAMNLDTIVIRQRFEWRGSTLYSWNDTTSVLFLAANRLCAVAPDLKMWLDKRAIGWEESQVCSSSAGARSANQSVSPKLALRIVQTATGLSISFTLPTTADVTLTLYTLNGTLVRTLIQASRRSGTHRVPVTDAELIGTAVYVVVLSAGKVGANALCRIVR